MAVNRLRKILFIQIMMVSMDLCYSYSCDVIPGQIGNFSFLPQSWYGGVRREPKYSTVVINCTASIADAKITMQLVSSMTGQWENYDDLGANLRPTMEQRGQIFVIPKFQSNTPQLFRCLGSWDAKKICNYKGILMASNPVVIVIDIFPKNNPLNGTLGEYFSFFCEAQGLGSTTESYLNWYKKTSSGEIEVDRSLIRREGFIYNGKPYDKERIEFKSLVKSDSGTYICKRQATSEVGEIKKKEVEFIVEDPTKPVMKLDRTNSKIDVLEGQKEEVKVVCSYVSGSPLPAKEWRDPRGKVVHKCHADSKTCTLTIKEPTRNDNHGRYTCVATNTGGTTRIDVMINVLFKVVLEKFASKEVAGYDEEATLSCNVKWSNPLPTIIWYYQPWSCTTTICKPNDQEWKTEFPKISITPASSVSTNESRLIVPPSKNNAFYRCRAENSFGTDINIIALHRLANPPTVFEVTRSPGPINENDTFVLNCSASSHLYTELRWMKNGVSLKDVAERIVLSTHFRDFFKVRMIKFNRIILKDIGNYTCNGMMKNGTEKSISYNVFVRALKSPVITGFKNQTLNETRENAVLFCNATGNPLPSISWKFEGNTVTEDGMITKLEDCSSRKRGRYFIIESHRHRKLVLCDMYYKMHQGIYECTAKSELGTQTSKMFVEILSRPKIVKWEEKVGYKPGSTIRIFCEAEGNPAPTVTIVRIEEGKKEQLKDLRKYGNGSVYISFIVNKETDRKYACLAENVAGKVMKHAQLTEEGRSTYILSKPISSSVIAAVVVSCILFLIIILVIAIWYKRRLEKKYAPYLKPNKYFQLDPDRTLFEQSSDLPYDPDWEFPRERLTFSKMIGSGAFGEVWLAEAEGILTLEPRDKTSNAAKRRSKIRRSQRYTHWQGRERKKTALPESAGEKTLVAVKTLKGDASDTEYKDLASELKILIHIGENKQIVNLLGACTRGGKLCVVLEYCPHGSLLNFLRDRRDIYEPVWFKNEADMSNELTNIDLTMIAYQIAKGLDFLSSKRCVHRDVAARNVLVGVDFIVKVADFGLARDIYKDEFYMKSTSGLLPVKWMAPESLFDKIYTSQSDVWSYGIVLWEIFTLGGSPYPGLPTEDLFNFLEQGRRMEQPELCPLEFYAIMNDCWERNPNDRPLFSQLVDRIAQIIANRSGQDNPYLEFDQKDAPAPPTESDYLEPIIPRTLPRDDYLAADNINSGFGNDRNSMRKAKIDDAPTYLNDDSVRMSLLEGYDEDDRGYANTKGLGTNEFVV